MLSASLIAVAPQGELVERTLAIVGGQVITLADVRTALALGLIEGSGPGDVIGAAAARLVDRLLILREVQRYVPFEPSDVQIESDVAKVRARFATPDLWAGALTAGGFSDARLRAWIRDDLRIASYLNQRFAISPPTDDEIRRHYTLHRDQFERQQLSAQAAAPIIRERLSRERRDELVNDWTADLRRRTPVVELWKRQE